MLSLDADPVVGGLGPPSGMMTAGQVPEWRVVARLSRENGDRSARGGTRVIRFDGGKPAGCLFMGPLLATARGDLAANFRCRSREATEFRPGRMLEAGSNTP